MRFWSPLALLLLTAQGTADVIDDFVQRQMSAQHIPGLNLLVIKDGQEIKRQSYGIASVPDRSPMKIDALLDMGSIGKTFTSTLVLQLVQEGKLKLSDPASKYVENWPSAWGNITIQQLLSHQAGLSEYAFIEGIGLIDNYDTKTWVEKVFATKLDFKTGTMFQYSNSNFVVLGLILEKVTGKPYRQLAQERIFDPAGMTRTTFRVKPGVRPPGTTNGYFWQNNEWLDMGPGGVSGVPSDGGGHTTVGDLKRYHDALESGKLVDRQLLRQAQSPSRTVNGRKTGYGLGWFFKKINDQVVVSHGGNSVGFSGTYFTIPNKKLEIYMLCNLYPVGGDAFAEQLALELVPELRPRPLENRKDPKPERTAKLLRALQEMAGGKVESDLFSADMKNRIATPRGQMALGSFARYKETKELLFIDERRDEKDRIVRYRAQSGNLKSVFEFTLEPDGRVTSIGRTNDPGEPKK